MPFIYATTHIRVKAYFNFFKRGSSPPVSPAVPQEVGAAPVPGWPSDYVASTTIRRRSSRVLAESE
jgi:hypothetical protein